MSEEARGWVEDGFARLERMLGRERMLRAALVLPDDRFFPDRYDRSLESVRAMAVRIAGYMGVPADSFVVYVYAEDEEKWREELPTGWITSGDAAGLYFHQLEEEKRVIGVHGGELQDPLVVAAVLAHELAHEVLLGGGLLDRNAEDMEPMTDLCTAYLGMGVICASASFQFKKWSRDRYEGWSVRRRGYLPQEVWAYVLAWFAAERGEHSPEWAEVLPTNVRAYFRQSAKWLARNRHRPQIPER